MVSTAHRLTNTYVTTYNNNTKITILILDTEAGADHELLLRHHHGGLDHPGRHHSWLHHRRLNHARLHHDGRLWLRHSGLVGEVSSIATLAPVYGSTGSCSWRKGPRLQLLFQVVGTASLNCLFRGSPLKVSSVKGREERRGREREKMNCEININKSFCGKAHFLGSPPLEVDISIPNQNEIYMRREKLP